jgi:hypothetical protein
MAHGKSQADMAETSAGIADTGSHAVGPADVPVTEDLVVG